MKVKSLLALTAALSFGVVAAQAATPAAPAAPAAQAPNLTDVPAGHWAKDAIDRLVSQGIILGYPDGTYRGTQNLTRYEAAVIIARLLDQIGSGNTQVTDPATLTALQNAVQELAADLAALGVRVSDLEDNAVSKDDFARLEDRLTGLEAGQGNPQALDELTTTINDLNTKVDDLQANYDTLRADVDDNASSIAALNDLTVLLNQDILNLQDRVSALEAGQIDRADFDALSTKVNGIDTRVGTLEKQPVVSLSGGISSTSGNIQLTSGSTNFDIDRLTTGTFLGKSLSDDDVTTTDTSNNPAGTDLNFGLGVKNLSTANGGITISDATLTFGVNNLFSSAGTTVTTPSGTATVNNDTTIRLKTAVLNGTLNAQPFSVGYNADYSKFRFNDYVADNNDSEDGVRRGVVATFSATGLPLSPSLTVVGGNGILLPAGAFSGETAAGPSTPLIPKSAAGPAAAYFGVRAAINPLGLGTLGLSYFTGTTATNNNVNQTTGVPANASVAQPRDIFSADYDFNVAGVRLDGVYAASIVRPLGFGNRDQAFYTRATATFGIVNVAANFRAIAPAFGKGQAGLSADGLQKGNNAAPFQADQYGYGVGAQGNLGFVTLGAYYDYRSNYTGVINGVGVTGRSFGVNAGAANVFAGFGLKAFYNNAVNTSGTTVDQAPFSTNDGYDAYSPSNSATATYQGNIPAPYRFTSSFGAVLTHDGKAANALIPNLNLSFGYANFYRSGANDFQAYGDYSGTFGGVTFKPFARYHTNSGGSVIINTNGDNTVDARAAYNTIKAGAQISTAPLGIFFAPSLDAGIAYRTTNFTGSTAATTGNANELFGKVGLVFNEFFAKDITFGLGYSYYSATNVTSGNVVGDAAVGSSFDVFRADRDRLTNSRPNTATFQAGPGAASATLNGVYTQLNVYGVKASYGVFNYFDRVANTNSVGQGFKLGYEVKF